MKSLTPFLEQHCDERPLLLGLSGGPDSMALLHLLRASDHSFHVAHIDHGWRRESCAQADLLAGMCREVPFHLKRLDPKAIDGNLEDGCRKARLTFFKELCQHHDLQGVLLGHHADDQAETVLKRVFEGASLPKLRGLTPKTIINGVTLLRPLLNVRKDDILVWLEEQNVPYFIDATNEDPRFLRARLRKNILPTLNKEFGKQVSTSLCRLGAAAAELNAFLETILEVYRQQVVRYEKEIVLDLSVLPPQTAFLWKAVVKDFFERENVVISHNVLETIVSHLQKRSCRIKVKIGRRWVDLDRGRINLNIS